MTNSDKETSEATELELLGPPDEASDLEEEGLPLKSEGKEPLGDPFSGGVVIGTIVATEILTPILQQFVKQQSIGFEFVNESSHTLSNPRRYQRNGFIGDMANTVPAKGYVGLGYGYGRKAGGAIAGVISYKINGTNKRLGMMYSMRKAFAVGYNYFKFATFDDDPKLPTKHAIWTDFYYNNVEKYTHGQCYPAHVGTRGWNDNSIKLKFEGTMPDGGEGIMRMVLRDK